MFSPDFSSQGMKLNNVFFLEINRNKRLKTKKKGDDYQIRTIIYRVKNLFKLLIYFNKSILEDIKTITSRKLEI